VDHAVHISGPAVVGTFPDNIIGSDLTVSISNDSGDGTVSIIEVYFTNNRIYNLPGPDFVVFEEGGTASDIVGEQFSLSVKHHGAYTAPIAFDPNATGLLARPGSWLFAAEIDLSDFGVTENGSVNTLRIELEDFGGAGSADIPAIGSLHSPIAVGGYVFPLGEQDFADNAFHISGPAVVGTLPDNVIGSDLTVSISNDSGDGTVSIVDTYFTDNRIFNLPGPDFIVFEEGGKAADLVGEQFKLSVYHNGAYTTPIVFVPNATGIEVRPGSWLFVAEIDLSDFGLSENDSINIARMQLEDFGPNGSADVAAIGSLHSMEAIGGYTFPLGEQDFVDDVNYISGLDPGAFELAKIIGSDVSTSLANSGGTGTITVIDALFLDNRIYNMPGPDLILFENGGFISGNFGESVSVSVKYNDVYTASIEYQTIYCGVDDSWGSLFAAEIDLTDFGVPEGDWINIVRIHLEDTGSLDSADVAAIGSLHSPQVLYPDGGEELIAGSGCAKEEILWHTNVFGDNVLLEYSTNNGTDWTSIDTVSNTGSYQWIVPQINTNQGLIRVSDSINPNIYDISELPFTILRLTADQDGNCMVNLVDFAIFCSQYLKGNPTL